MSKKIISKYFIACFFVLLLQCHSYSGSAQEKFPVLDKWMQFTDAPNFLYRHLSNIAFKQLDERENNIRTIKNLPQFLAYQKLTKEALQKVVGPFPERTPLNPVITRKINKGTYTIENIIFESRPGMYVTSSLFIPAGKKKQMPAIIYCSGHTMLGYRQKGYQFEMLNLVSKGFIVFAIDPIGQGERQQYLNEKNVSIFDSPTKEHSFPGAQLFISGSSLANYMIWDGIRAVDYLMTRKEVDAKRIGIAGRSGGGTQSAYIAALDDRIYAAVPENYITNFRRLFEEFGPQDAEQNFLYGIKNHLDHADLLEVRAPKPVLMVTTSRDIFSIQGALETKKEVSGIYQLFGKEENFDIVESDTVHASTVKNREHTYAFFQKHLNNPGDSTEHNLETLTDELKVTQTGQVVSSIKEAKILFNLNKKMMEKELSNLSIKRKEKDYITNVLKTSRELSGYLEPKEVENPVFTGRYQRDGYAIEKYFVKGEGDYVFPYLLVIPQKVNGKAVIYLNSEAKSEGLVSNEAKWLVQNGFTVLLPDLLGIGELGKGSYKGDSFIDSVSYGLWFFSVLTGRSIVGIQAGDINRLVHILKKNHQLQEIYGFGEGAVSSSLI